MANVQEKLAFKILEVVDEREEVTPQQIRDLVEGYKDTYLKNTLKIMVDKGVLNHEGGRITRGRERFTAWGSLIGKTTTDVVNAKRWNRLPGSVS